MRSEEDGRNIVSNSVETENRTNCMSREPVTEGTTIACSLRVDTLRRGAENRHGRCRTNVIVRQPDMLAGGMERQHWTTSKTIQHTVSSACRRLAVQPPHLRVTSTSYVGWYSTNRLRYACTTA